MDRCEAALGGVCSSIMQWSGTTRWQQQVTGTSLPYPLDFYGMLQTGGWREPQEHIPPGICHRQHGLSQVLAAQTLPDLSPGNWEL